MTITSSELVCRRLLGTLVQSSQNLFAIYIIFNDKETYLTALLAMSSTVQLQQTMDSAVQSLSY